MLLQLENNISHCPFCFHREGIACMKLCGNIQVPCFYKGELMPSMQERLFIKNENIMATKKSNPVVYKREKDKVEISGDADCVKWQIWFDLISARLFWIGLAIILLCTVPQVSFVPLVWKWLKHQFLIFLPVLVVCVQMLLSG